MKDIRPDHEGSYPRGLLNVNGSLYFLANDGSHGYELWTSDGTEIGTVMVTDIKSGISSSVPSYLTDVNGTLFFTADDGIHGRELWALAPAPQAEVVGSHVYHKGSAFAAGGSNIPAALDTVKQLAKEGATPITLGYNHLMNSSRGINGLVFDINGLPGNLASDDFEFQMSPTGAFDSALHPPSCWQTAISPSQLFVQADSPSRVVIEWPDNVITERYEPHSMDGSRLQFWDGGTIFDSNQSRTLWIRFVLQLDIS